MWCAFSISISAGSRQHDLEEPHDGLVQLRAPVALGQHLDSRASAGLDVERDRDQRQPRHQVGCADRSRRCASRSMTSVVGVVAPEIHQLPQELAPKRVRRGRRVGFAGGVQLAEARGGVAQRFEQPRLADAGLARRSRSAGRRPRARSRSASRMTPSSALRPVNGSRCSETCRVREPCARPTDHAWIGCALPLTANGSSSRRLEQRIRAVEHVGRRVDHCPAPPWPSGARPG